MWKHLIHPNIVPLLGMTSAPLQLVSEWIFGGDLTEHIKKYPSTDRLNLVRAPPLHLVLRLLSHQLSDVAKGLHFLHSRNVVHGDLRGVRGYSRSCFTLVMTRAQPNILVDTSGHARITDFCLATVTQNLDSMRSASGGPGHTARWTAPEILNEGEAYSREADVFSFAMVMIEVRHESAIYVEFGSLQTRTTVGIYRRSPVQ